MSDEIKKLRKAADALDRWGSDGLVGGLMRALPGPIAAWLRVEADAEALYKRDENSGHPPHLAAALAVADAVLGGKP